MLERIHHEPALTLGVVQALVALGVGFGLPVTPEQVALIVALSAALLSWVTRTQVTPTGTWTATRPPEG